MAPFALGELKRCVWGGGQGWPLLWGGRHDRPCVSDRSTLCRPARGAAGAAWPGSCSTLNKIRKRTEERVRNHVPPAVAAAHRKGTRQLCARSEPRPVPRGRPSTRPQRTFVFIGGRSCYEHLPVDDGPARSNIPRGRIQPAALPITCQKATTQPVSPCSTTPRPPPPFLTTAPHPPFPTTPPPPLCPHPLSPRHPLLTRLQLARLVTARTSSPRAPRDPLRRAAADPPVPPRTRSAGGMCRGTR